MGSDAWVPLTDDGSPAAANAEGRWLDQAADLIATDADGRVALWTAESLTLEFPRNWPTVFKESPTLKGLINKKMLNGTRCRAVSLTAAPTTAARSAAAAAKVDLRPLHSFSNASRVADALGYGIVKGFIVFERPDVGVANGSFVALRYWWNVTSDGSWIDLTPPLGGSVPVAGSGAEDRELLVESEQGEKKPAPLTPARREFAVKLAQRIANGRAGGAAVDISAGDATPAPAASATSAKPSSTATATTPAAQAAAGGAKAGAAPAAAAAAAATTTTDASSASKPVLSSTTEALKHSKVDYSKWRDIEVSDDEEDDQETTQKKVEQQEQLKQMAEEHQRQQAEAQSLNSAIDAAALASAVGNHEALDAMMDHAQAAAPLDADMEAVLANLPEAARLAARASATAQRAAAATAGAPEAGKGGTATPAKEPTLAELLKQQNISLEDDGVRMHTCHDAACRPGCPGCPGSGAALIAFLVISRLLDVPAPTALGGCLPGCLAACLPGWLPGCLAAWLPDYLAAWLPGCLAAWLPGWLPHRAARAAL